MEEFASGRWKGGRGRSRARVPREDFIVARKKGERYAISLDPEGKLAWTSNTLEGGGETNGSPSCGVT